MTSATTSNHPRLAAAPPVQGPADAASPQSAETTRQRWVLALAATASFIVALDTLVMSTALAEIGREFGASIEALEWTVNAYILTFAVFLMSAAALGDRFGRRRIFVAGLAVFVLASAACALAPSIGWLITARAVQGVGAAAIMPLALALVSAAFPPERRGWALGIYSSVTAFSSVAGPIVGGAVTQGFAWQFVFWLNLPLGAIVIACALTRLPESFGPKSKIDLPGLLLVTGASLGLVWGLVRANEAGWASREVAGSLGFGVLLAAGFVAWQMRAAAPMIPMRLFRSRLFCAGNATMFLLYGAMMGALFFMAQFQQVAQGHDPMMAGLRILPWGIALVAMATRANALAERFGAANVVISGLLLQAAGLVWLALTAAPETPYLTMAAAMFVTGAGFAVAIPLVQKTVVGAVPLQDIGKASGTLSMIRQLGAAFGIALAVMAFARFGDHTGPQAFAGGFAAATGAMAMMSLLGACIGLGLRGRPS